MADWRQGITRLCHVPIRLTTTGGTRERRDERSEPVAAARDSRSGHYDHGRSVVCCGPVYRLSLSRDLAGLADCCGIDAALRWTQAESRLLSSAGDARRTPDVHCARTTTAATASIFGSAQR